MKKTSSLKQQILILMALLVALQSTALVLSLVFSQVFGRLDAESFRLFHSTTESRATAFNKAVGELVAGIAWEADQLSEAVRVLSEQEGVHPSEAYLNDELFREVAMSGADSVINILRSYSVTGAFVVFNGSNANKNNYHAHSAIYIRNTAPDFSADSTQNMQIEIGPSFVSKEYQIAMSINWDLELLFADDDSYPFYTNPVQAGELYTGSELERYGYWCPDLSVIQDGQKVISYTMPLLDRDGIVFGVIGLELSPSHIARNYLPSTELPYRNSFYAVAPSTEDALLLDWFIPGGPLAQAYLEEGTALPIKNVGEGLYTASLEGLGAMYCSLQNLRVYSDNSPFVGETWTLVSFVSQDVLHETSKSVRTILTGSIVIITAVSFLAVIFLSWYATRDISTLPDYIRSFSPNREISFRKTGIQEIDELTAAIEMLNQSVMNASKTATKIMELTAMPMGGFEVSTGGDYVVLTGFLHQLLGLDPEVSVSPSQWDELYATLIAEPAPDYRDVYRYPDSATGGARWLRIQQADTDTGYVGSVLDVSGDIEHSLSLAHELDFDALTHLYSRTAFKRKVYEMTTTAPEQIGALVFADLDNLKYINDTYGHDIGDRFLIQAAAMFSRFSETGGVVSRISGDEFAIYLHGYQSREDVLTVIRKEFDSFQNCILTTPDGKKQIIRSSAGVAFYPQDADNATNLLKLADFAMYEAKHNSKGSLFEFNMQSYQKDSATGSGNSMVIRLIEEELIRFALQPIVQLSSGKIIGYEMLLRSMLDGYSSPLEIISEARQQSRLAQLEHVIMYQGFQYIHDHRMQSGEIQFFINSLSGHHLTEDDISFLMQRYPELARYIVLEVVDSPEVPIEHYSLKLEHLRRMGAKFAIDQITSNFQDCRILYFQPDYVKTDLSVIRNIHHNETNQRLVSEIVAWCKKHNIQVIAVGVENEEDLKTVYHLGVDAVQGFFMGAPTFSADRISERALTVIQALNKTDGKQVDF